MKRRLHRSRARAACASWHGAFDWHSGNVGGERKARRVDGPSKAVAVFSGRVSHAFSRTHQGPPCHCKPAWQGLFALPPDLGASSRKTARILALGGKWGVFLLPSAESPEALGARGGLLSGLVLIQLSVQIDDRAGLPQRLRGEITRVRAI